MDDFDSGDAVKNSETNSISDRRTHSNLEPLVLPEA
jgi:hypothetical protein